MFFIGSYVFFVNVLVCTTLTKKKTTKIYVLTKQKKPKKFKKKNITKAYYTPPEVLKGIFNARRKADIWSVGIILFCMLFGFLPFYVTKDELIIGEKKENNKMKELIIKGFNPTIKPGYGPWFPEDLQVSDEARNLISAMLKSDPWSRITVSNALSHPWISGSNRNNDKILPQTVFASLRRHCSSGIG